MTRLIAYTAYR